MAFEKGGFTLNETHTIPFINQTYIYVRCIDEEGKALAGRPYVIVLPDGKQVRGELDDDGWARHDGIKPGECTFKLIDPDVEIVDRGEGGTHFINIVVKDEEGRPLVDEPYILGMGNGQIRRGTLDGEGRCLEERIPAGACFFALKGGIDTKARKNRHLRLQFMDEDGAPLAERPFQLRIGEDTVEGITSEDGRVIADVPGEVDDGELTIWVDKDKSGDKFTWPIRISEVSSSK
jgi:hypothetical protein